MLELPLQVRVFTVERKVEMVIWSSDAIGLLLLVGFRGRPRAWCSCGDKLVLLRGMVERECTNGEIPNMNINEVHLFHSYPKQLAVPKSFSRFGIGPWRFQNCWQPTIAQYCIHIRRFLSRIGVKMVMHMYVYMYMYNSVNTYINPHHCIV